MLVRHGYGVLLLDARGYDGSQGDPNLFGWDDAKDIDAAVAWLQRQPDVRGGRIGGIGFSVGGEMMLQAAASNTGLRAVVSEGAGFRSVREDCCSVVHAAGSRSPKQLSRRAAIAVMSGTAPPPPLKDLVPRIAPRHVFFVYAGHGAGGEEFNPDLLPSRPSPEGASGRSPRPAMSADSTHAPESTNNASSASSITPCSGGNDDLQATYPRPVAR